MAQAAAALDTAAVRVLFVEQVGKIFEHDAAQLLGIDDRPWNIAA